MTCGRPAVPLRLVIRDTFSQSGCGATRHVLGMSQLDGSRVASCSNRVERAVRAPFEYLDQESSRRFISRVICQSSPEDGS